MSAPRSLGSIAFVLHSHIPYVLSHGRWPHGTDWLLEVTAESYVPLLDALYDLAEEGASPRITVGLTPVLVEQLADESFKSEFSAYAKTRARAASENKREFQRLKDEPMIHLADFWHEYYSDILRSFTTRFKRSLVKAFAELQDVGHIEIMTSSATHGYSPLLSQDASLQAQVKQGVATYKRHFKRQPLGYWLPECAYRPGYRWSPPLQPKGRTIEPYCRKGVEEFLRESGLKYFIIESHLLHGGETRGVYIDRFGALQKLWKQYMEEEPALDAVKTPYAAYMLTPTKADDAPVCVFVRDHVTGSQVWSRWQGYPGDEWYLEFHKKHSPGGLRYWRVTSPDVDLGDKLVYEPARTEERVTSHVEHFVGTVREVLRRHLGQTGAPGVICAPYDTELYGHWWFEGVGWLKRVLKAMNNDPEIELTTCSDYLEKHPPTTEISLPEGSWGEGGFHYMWLNEQTEWTWSKVYDAELEMQDLVRSYGGKKELLPMLKQAARELLLLQSSDWQFSISTQSSKDYGELRLTEHYKSFQRLAQMIRKMASGQQPDEAEWNAYKACEERDCLFPDVDPKWFACLENPPAEGK